jgi:hypothetical protein
MLRKNFCASGRLMLLTFLLSVFCRVATSQDIAMPLDPNDPRLSFSFSIQPGVPAFRFKVGLNKAGYVTGVSVSREGESVPFQALPKCAIIDIPEPVSDNWQAYEPSMLLTHADLNFDGFEDLELLTYDIPHLDKKLYCIYLWDNKAGRFRYSNALTELAVNPVPNPANKTITMHENWQGGLWTESTYRWNGVKPELIEQNSLLANGSLKSNQECRFTFTCSRLVDGKMVRTLEKQVCSPTDNLPPCSPSASSPTLSADKTDSSETPVQRKR